MNFTIKKQEYDRVIPTIVEGNPKFKESEQYKLLIGNSEDLPSIVASADSAYIEYLIQGNCSDDIKAEISKPLNEIASWTNEKTDTLIIHEFLENLDEAGYIAEMLPFFNNELRSLVEGMMALRKGT